jgi:hypothetical protein
MKIRDWQLDFKAWAGLYIIMIQSVGANKIHYGIYKNNTQTDNLLMENLGTNLTKIIKSCNEFINNLECENEKEN